ncbi:transposase [Microbulbifer sp. DLAB2-AA]|uniref:transposase n=1 Tax=Microbulbifer sp. DLAB2-AA TaxID=3243394 RepID=UPI004039C34F
MVVVDGEGILLGGTITSASPAEVKLLHPLNRKIHRLVYDKAADSDPLRDSLLSRGIDLICPHRRNRKKASRQDGRKLRRYTRCWKVERTFTGWEITAIWLLDGSDICPLIVTFLYCMHVNYLKEVMK